jgi:hypothetical protein
MKIIMKFIFMSNLLFRHMPALEKGNFSPAIALKTFISQLFQSDAGVKIIHHLLPPLAVAYVQ